jgi:hypothetical protein
MMPADDVMTDPFASSPASNPPRDGGPDPTDFAGALTILEWSAMNQYDAASRTYRRTD